MIHLPATILACSDGSPKSRKAVAHGGALAKAVDAKLHLVHVGLLSRYTNPDNLNASQYERLKTEARARFDNEIAWARENEIDIFKDHLRMGRVDAEVIRVAEEIGADMIMVGNRGVGAISRILLGSDAESIVRHAHCDVVVLRVE